MRRIDHMVVAVRDLDEAANFYHRLGFQVGSRNQHPWGTENRLIQFGSSFIELITVGQYPDLIPPHERRRLSFGAFIRDYLQQREGLAMLVLSSDDAEADAARFAEADIGDFEPFSFERKGKRPNGDETRVAFSLAFARNKNAPDLGFFVCQQHHPENFWDFRFQHHVNGGTNITALTLTTAAPEKQIAFFEPFTGISEQPGQFGHYTLPLDGGQIDVMQDTNARPPSLTSFTVQVDDVHQVAEMLATQKIPFTGSDGFLVISNSCAFGVEIRLEHGRKLR